MQKYFIRSMVFMTMILMGDDKVRGTEVPQFSHGKKSSQEREWGPFDQLTPEEQEKYRAISSFLKEVMNKTLEIKNDINNCIGSLEGSLIYPGNIIPNKSTLNGLVALKRSSPLKKKQATHMNSIYSKITDLANFNRILSEIKDLNEKIYNNKELPTDHFKENIKNQNKRFEKIENSLIFFDELLKKCNEDQLNQIEEGAPYKNEDSAIQMVFGQEDSMFFPNTAIEKNEDLKPRVNELLASIEKILSDYNSVQKNIYIEHIDNFYKSLRGTVEIMRILVDFDEKKYTDVF